MLSHLKIFLHHHSHFTTLITKDTALQAFLPWFEQPQSIHQWWGFLRFRGASWRAKRLTERLKPSSSRAQELIKRIRRGEASVSVTWILGGNLLELCPLHSPSSISGVTRDLRCDCEQAFHYPSLSAIATTSVSPKSHPPDTLASRWQPWWQHC